MEENKIWSAKWIWPRNSFLDKHEIVYFRRSFFVENDQCQLNINVSADSRYRLFLNGKSVCVGPLKGDNHTHYYETVDLSPYLKKGKNVLAAKVLHYSPLSSEPSPESIWHSTKGGFLLEGSLQSSSGETIEILDSNQDWKCLIDHAIHYEAESWLSSIWLGGVERVNGAKLPHGWQSIEHNDSKWDHAVPFLDPQLDHGLLTPWQLTKRSIPFLYEKEKAFSRVMRSDEENLPLTNVFINNTGPLHLLKGKQFIVELDAGELTTGYLNIKVS
ncbi:alpha-L-rhamnosidase N-terminal domain-containing protein [Bacillus sp. FJAT-49732]|uniref:Alpha-L-rhamnosidase N-terminal domain-containing protein n=1 Tax=Lederbergia citrisecunda TaxID=2833583 RepID=A0A942TQ56_9BACI|nr:alpha-L-rhamnosidase N-terminal domain-containing protein [Lederbergia citrisecunda]MBS4199874.1 alpha-L-rhamnosidase N-terminal domain-containing protein [Lederbergia citrisecunda]